MTAVKCSRNAMNLGRSRGWLIGEDPMPADQLIGAIAIAETAP